MTKKIIKETNVASRFLIPYASNPASKELNKGVSVCQQPPESLGGGGGGTEKRNKQIVIAPTRFRAARYYHKIPVPELSVTVSHGKLKNELSPYARAMATNYDCP